MDVPDAVVGKIILVTTSLVFILISIWINTYPFIDEESGIYSLLLEPGWFELFCAVWGLVFVGGLMCYTLYQLLVHPY